MKVQIKYRKKNITDYVQNLQGYSLLTILIVRFAAFLFDDLASIAIIESVSSEQLITT